MLLLSVAITVLVFLAVMLVAGNNLSACVGPAVGSRIITKRFAALLGATGFSAGLLIQGSFMTNSVATLLPNATATLRAEALLVAIVVFTVAYVIRVPMSLSMSLVGLLGGLSVAGNSPANSEFAVVIILTWILVPFVSFSLAFLLIRFFNRRIPINFWHRLQEFKILLILLSFLAAYVTGANTLGLIVATSGFDWMSILAGVAAIFVGSFFLSQGAIKRVSQEFFSMRYGNAAATLLTSTVLVELATIFNIPLSITQTTTTAVFGIGVSYKTKLVSAKSYVKIIAGWIIAPLISFFIGFFIG